MAADDSNTALFDRTNALLSSFAQQAFKAQELASSVPVRDLAKLQQSQQTDNFTRWTQDVTGVTGFSDSGLVMDSGDRERAGEDLKVFKDHVSTLKFAYLESNAKLEFVNHVMNEQGYQPIAQGDNDEMAKRRLVAKSELKEKKQRTIELESRVRHEAEELEQHLARRTREAEHAARLLRECEAMETEIAMLKNKRSPTEHLTLEQAVQADLEQQAEIESLGRQTAACTQEIDTLKHQTRRSKVNVERYSHTVKQLKREQDERDAKGVQDERAEEACEWLDTTMKLYKSLLDIHAAYAIGSPPREIVFEYGPVGADKGVMRKLSIKLGADGRMTGASLIDSSENVQDIVQTHLASQDVPSLIQEVRARIQSHSQPRPAPLSIPPQPYSSNISSMKRRFLALFLVAASATSAFAAPAAQRTALPDKRALEPRKDDVIVNVGAVTTVKTVVRTAVPTTVYVPVTIDDKPTSSPVVSTTECDITTVITQTAVETQVVYETVTDGQTIPVTMTTTAFQVQLATETQVVKMTSTQYQQSTVVQTVQGVPVTQVVTVMQTPAAQPAPPSSANNPPAPPSSSDKKADDKEAEPTTKTKKPADSSSSIPPSVSTATATTTANPSLNLNNTADADANSGASVDSSNTNTNNVSVSLSDDAGGWVSDNKWIIIGVVVGVILIIIIAIIAFATNSGKGSSSGPVVISSSPASAPAAAPSTTIVNARPVQSLGRPSRRTRREYAAVVPGDSSEMSDSSADEKPAYPAPSRRGSMASAASAASRGRRGSVASGAGDAEMSLGRRASRSRSRSRA
ncbi:hypothetical protein JCM11641_004530 [Rhodosporidiobolus odoratus]